MTLTYILFITACRNLCEHFGLDVATAPVEGCDLWARYFSAGITPENAVAVESGSDLPGATVSGFDCFTERPPYMDWIVQINAICKELQIPLTCDVTDEGTCAMWWREQYINNVVPSMAIELQIGRSIRLRKFNR